MAVASSKSRLDRPPASWVVSVISTLFQTLRHSGWWSRFSASKATRHMKPHAWLKSLNVNSFEMAAPARAQPGRAASAEEISVSVAATTVINDYPPRSAGDCTPWRAKSRHELGVRQLPPHG